MATTEEMEQNLPVNLKISRILIWLMYIWTTLGVIALTLRVLLLIAGANLAVPFAAFVMHVSSSYLKPFRGIFPPENLSDTNILDVSAIFAIIVYLFVGWGFKALVTYIQHKIDQNISDQQTEQRRREISAARSNQSKNTRQTR